MQGIYFKESKIHGYLERWKAKIMNKWGKYTMTDMVTIRTGDSLRGSTCVKTCQVVLNTLSLANVNYTLCVCLWLSRYVTQTRSLRGFLCPWNFPE